MAGDWFYRSSRDGNVTYAVAAAGHWRLAVIAPPFWSSTIPLLVIAVMRVLVGNAVLTPASAWLVGAVKIFSLNG